MEERSDSFTFLGEHLLHKGFIAPNDLEKARTFQQRIGGRFSSILTRIGAISEENLLQALSSLLGMRVFDAQADAFNPHDFLHAIRQSGIELDWWLDQEVLIWEGAENKLCCVGRDPMNETVAEVLERVFPDRELEFLLVRNYDLDRMLDQVARHGADSSSGHSDADQLRELAEEAPVIAFVNNLLAQAFDQRASDIHIEPGETILEIRYRIDGILYTPFSLPRERFPAICSRIKLISGMDISERRLPQDGRLTIRMSGEEVDIRVSSVPGVHGESVVLRLLPKEGMRFSLDSLGLEEDSHELLQSWISQPHGIILVTGPTGSGKSTTLYAALEKINDRKKKIITVEDPVEYQLEGITQIQTHSEIGYSFARALRSILRQDPDVILIGEIRDKETAEIAIQASLTGHLVLATLHTNDAVSAFTRLIDMGVEPFLVATPVRGVMAQRLVRRLCRSCAEPMEPFEEIRKMTETLLPESWRGRQSDWRSPRGCPKCQGTGYTGREGIYEMVDVSGEVQHLILSGGSPAEMRETVKKQNLRTLREDGLLKAWKGVTSLEEVLRVTSE